MSQRNNSDATYVMGRPAGEEQRLQSLLVPSTKCLFEQAGITAGMKVLDVGSLADEMALALAEWVSPTGALVSFPSIKQNGGGGILVGLS